MKLQKFRKNGKQKGIAIGCAIALLITIAGVNLYRTFALYKEEKTFNVLRGVVPDFTRVTTTYNVNGKTDTNPPAKSSGYNVSVSCVGATGTWDSLNWKLNVTNKTQKEITCTVTFTQKPLYKDTILSGADPVLSGDLVAVKVDPSTGAVTKADIYSEWYNYTNKQWANAIIPTSEAKSAVQSLSAGQTIDESQIESYFVWIPKYKYKIQTLGESSQGQEQAFDIIFGTTNTTDINRTECPTPNTSGNSGKCAVGEYMTHPAFLAFGTNGLWVGKFETGESGADRAGATERETYKLEDLSKIIVKPNSYSWTYANVSTMYLLAYNYQRTLDSHMMKNTEWGAVAYLTQSIYGRCDEDLCTEVYANNDGGYRTGFGPPQGIYPDSNYASTTGNCTGIYDMVGGAIEAVMGLMYAKGDEIPSFESEYQNTGFTNSNFPTDSRYYDLYKYRTSSSTYITRILGDATAETASWYYDDEYGQQKPSDGSPWYSRGGWSDAYKGSSTIFYYEPHAGGAWANFGFRLVLAPS